MEESDRGEVKNMKGSSSINYKSVKNLKEQIERMSNGGVKKGDFKLRIKKSRAQILQSAR